LVCRKRNSAPRCRSLQVRPAASAPRPTNLKMHRGNGHRQSDAVRHRQDSRVQTTLGDPGGVQCLGRPPTHPRRAMQPACSPRQPRSASLARVRQGERSEKSSRAGRREQRPPPFFPHPVANSVQQRHAKATMLVELNPPTLVHCSTPLLNALFPRPLPTACSPLPLPTAEGRRARVELLALTEPRSRSDRARLNPAHPFHHLASFPALRSPPRGPFSSPAQPFPAVPSVIRPSHAPAPQGRSKPTG